jgi:hypothetical protein
MVEFYGLAPAKGIEDESSQSGGEDSIAGVHSFDRLGQLVGGDGFGDISPSAGADHGDDIFGLVGNRKGEKADVGVGFGNGPYDRHSPSPRHVDVDQHHVRSGFPDSLDGVIDIGGRADDLRPILKLASHSGQEEAVVVN